MATADLPKGGKFVLHLGVLVQPYRNRKGKVASLTTGDVARILEDNYGIMAAFWRVHREFVANALMDSLSGMLENIIAGGYRPGSTVDPWGSATQAIEQRFRDFINSREVEGVGLVGVPTQAALRGVSHRLAHPYAKANARRPSFRDTGLYVTSFRATIDGSK